MANAIEYQFKINPLLILACVVFFLTLCSLFNQEITIADAISKLDTNNNDYNLDLLKISAPNGDFDWTTDDAEGSVSVSNLYDKLVVKSNKKWASRTKADTINQDITGAHHDHTY